MKRGLIEGGLHLQRLRPAHTITRTLVHFRHFSHFYLFPVIDHIDKMKVRLYG